MGVPAKALDFKAAQQSASSPKTQGCRAFSAAIIFNMTELQLRKYRGWAVLAGVVLGGIMVFFMHRAASEHVAQKATQDVQCARLLAAVKNPNPQYRLECVFDHNASRP
ncbi:MAG: hypothetical protein LBJ15_23205 [Comamonas sp.]|jgi:hypothetical protein|uniref:hypothetical protein n=1 Tax=Comamonas sp. TaxID=34028 RepID=UPI002837E690|nr:hypothetical protein [Comamonas sp.]MDR0216895.1 hypothetical protein [Comamonas sp.]